MDELNDQLKHVAWQIAMAKKIITDQLALIEALRAGGIPFAFAEQTLRTMVRMLDSFQADQRDLRSAIEQKSELLEQ